MDLVQDHRVPIRQYRSKNELIYNDRQNVMILMENIKTCGCKILYLNDFKTTPWRSIKFKPLLV